MPIEPYEIDLGKSFDRLKYAPIIEAVVEIKCPSTAPWAEDTIPDEFAKSLDGYRFLDSSSRYWQSVKFEDNVPSIPLPMQKVELNGVRYRSDDESYIAAFNRDGFLFSRVGRYETWAQFRDEAMRGWQVHKSLAKPSDILRIGLRFINRIGLRGVKDYRDEFIYGGPKPSGGLNFPIISFLNKNSFTVPGHPYLINILRTESSAPPVGGEEGYAIILDIDVYLQETFAVDDGKLRKHLEDMRILKNDIFSDSVPPALLESLRGENG